MGTEKVISIANNEVGYIEKATNSKLDSKTENAGKNNYTKYARDLYAAGYYNGNKNGYAWCDVFVDWCFFKAYGSKTTAEMVQCQTSNLGAGCKYSMQYYKAQNRCDKNPKVGDQIFFYDSTGGVGHTGLVYKVTDSIVYTIEGNTSSASGVVANGGTVALKSYQRSYSKIAGYGHPRYELVEDEPVVVGWKQDDKGWWYVHADGSYTKDGWEKVSGEWYYFDEEGYMMANTWCKGTDGLWYYAGEDGKLLRNKNIVLDKTGAMVPVNPEKRYVLLKDVDQTVYRSALDDLIKEKYLYGNGGSGDDLELDMSEDSVRILTIVYRILKKNNLI